LWLAGTSHKGCVWLSLALGTFSASHISANGYHGLYERVFFVSVILGVSGLHNSVPFKQSRFPGLNCRQYRMAQGFDSAAALLTDGRLHAAVAEERFTGVKATGAFPENAIRHCLAQGRQDLAAVDIVAHGFSYEPWRSSHLQDQLTADRFAQVYARQVLVDKFEATFGGQWDDRLVQVPHHIAHAASAFYPSGFESALILVADGMGERDSMTVAVGSRSGIERIASVSEVNSLGILYGVLTYYLGFAFGMDEYKVMGLAPYGDRSRYFSQLMDLVTLHDNGTFTVPILYQNATDLDRETYAGTLAELARVFGPPREPEEEVTDRHRDLAAGLQAVLEATMMHVLRHFRQQTGQRHLCMAGGVALNCTANGMILRSRLFRSVYVQPAAGDDGTALGAALHVAHDRECVTSFANLDTPLCGPAFSDQEIADVVESQAGVSWTRFDDFKHLAATLAKHLADGRVAGLFQGALEFGPRALGNRSILGDPRDPTMRDQINARVKKREAFRPFAPAVLEEAATEYFDIRPSDVKSFSWMLFTTQVRPQFQDALPAVTHVDGTARVQTVARSTNERFWTIIDAFAEITGISTVLNTSFNVKGQPMVCTPQEAMDTFLAAKLDVLVIGNYLVEPSEPAA
jgi:carbamoyltransferase